MDSKVVKSLTKEVNGIKRQVHDLNRAIDKVNNECKTRVKKLSEDREKLSIRVEQLLMRLDSPLLSTSDLESKRLLHIFVRAVGMAFDRLGDSAMDLDEILADDAPITLPVLMSDMGPVSSGVLSAAYAAIPPDVMFLRINELLDVSEEYLECAEAAFLNANQESEEYDYEDPFVAAADSDEDNIRECASLFRDYRLFVCSNLNKPVTIDNVELFESKIILLHSNVASLELARSLVPTGYALFEMPAVAKNAVPEKSSTKATKADKPNN